jgi:uncharacterized protein YoxC
VNPWLAGVIALCLVAVTIALVPTILALRSVAQRTERVLAIVEGDLRPTLERVEALLDEARELTHDLRGEVERLGALTRRVTDVSEGVGRVMNGLVGLTRAGQLMGVAAGVKTGLDVFLHRLRRRGGDGHG